MVEAIVLGWIGTLYERDKGLFPYSEQVLQKLKPKYKLGLVTKAGSGVEVRRKEIKASGILPYFDSVIIDTVKAEEQFSKCIREMKTVPEETAIVDKPTEETGKPNYTINSIKDLLNIL